MEESEHNGDDQKNVHLVYGKEKESFRAFYSSSTECKTKVSKVIIINRVLYIKVINLRSVVVV